MSQQGEQTTNEPSLLLEKEENERVFDALGPRRVVSCHFYACITLTDVCHRH